MYLSIVMTSYHYHVLVPSLSLVNFLAASTATYVLLFDSVVFYSNMGANRVFQIPLPLVQHDPIGATYILTRVGSDEVVSLNAPVDAAFAILRHDGLDYIVY